MKKVLSGFISVVLLTFAVSTLAHSEPVDTGEADSSAWQLTLPLGVDPPQNAIAHAESGPGDPGPNSEDDEVLNQSAGSSAAASVLRAEASASNDPTLAATLQSIMDGAATPALPTQWSARAYSRVEGFRALGDSILGDSILVDTVESEAVVGRVGNQLVQATAARVVNLRLAGALALQSLAPIVPDVPNQVLLDGPVKIVYWETNWNPATNGTTDGQPVWVNALHISQPLTGIDIALGHSGVSGSFTPTPPNNPPVAQDDSTSTLPGVPVQIDVDPNDSDPDGDLDPSTVTVTAQPQAGSVTCDNTGVCTYTPDPGFTGQDTFTYQICDSKGECDTAVVTITVAAGPVNLPPNAVDDSASTQEGTPVTIDVVNNDTDPEGNLDPASVTITVQPQNGAVTCDATGACSYTPSQGFTGQDTFTYQVCDDATPPLCDTAQVTVTVSAGPGPGPSPTPTVPVPTPSPTVLVPSPTPSPTPPVPTPSPTPPVPTPSPTVPVPTPSPTVPVPTPSPTVPVPTPAPLPTVGPLPAPEPLPSILPTVEAIPDPGDVDPDPDNPQFVSDPAYPAAPQQEGPNAPPMPFTGAPVIAFLALAANLITAGGSALALRRHRPRRLASNDDASIPDAGPRAPDLAPDWDLVVASAQPRGKPTTKPVTPPAARKTTIKPAAPKTTRKTTVKPSEAKTARKTTVKPSEAKTARKTRHRDEIPRTVER